MPSLRQAVFKVLRIYFSEFLFALFALHMDCVPTSDHKMLRHHWTTNRNPNLVPRFQFLVDMPISVYTDEISTTLSFVHRCFARSPERDVRELLFQTPPKREARKQFSIIQDIVV